ncbi:hypothetical protein Poli38472_007336 [Pythium oligandrum]|uniref:Fe2OG dioxygenase domain-containing protein n=1 Tax=Pythium oligandrum TaxID=41045 RepID=A0A8K1FE99_PYTOL|nr:hypothetical protein Poli38472_007336 [Pythium oligandrum]|eukprot:TMW59191.1 hypothetical protein Poli38472_007336 [Pythium oligandrum]
MTEHLKCLRAIGERGQAGVFACSGVDETPRAISLCYKTESSDYTGCYTKLDFPLAQKERVDELVVVCDPARHDRGNQTVLDTSYRLAWTLDASKFTLSFDLSELSILQKIQQFLTPQDELSARVGVRASLCKLNIYGPGGFFKKHVDKPHGSDVFATLIVCLPSQFSGGALTVRHNGEEDCMAWGDKGSTTSNTLRWGAFFSDCEHWIDEVTSGVLITLTYQLEYITSLQMPLSVDPIEGNLLLEKLQEALQTPSFAPQGTTLGVGLAHLYAIDESQCISMLKGADQVWQEALQLLGLRYKLALAFKPECDDEDDRRQMKYDWKEESEDFWDGDGNLDLFIRGGLYFMDGTRIDWVSFDHMRDELRAVPRPDIVWIAPPKSLLYQERVTHNGNEPIMQTHYGAVCFLVTVPPARERIWKEG